MKALLIDDERLARLELRRLLAEGCPWIEVVGEAANVDEAWQEINRTRPGLLFLDIQMPAGSGFDLLSRLSEEGGHFTEPRIVFVTAFDEHALRAFEFGVCDYLLKPIDPKRLAEALRRLARRDESEDTGSEPSPALGAQERVLVRDGERCFFVQVGDILLVESQGNYARVFFGSGSALVPRTLNSLEARLDPTLFFRASRQHLVNLRWVERVEPWFGGSLLLVMAGGQRIEMSRRQSQRFEQARRL
jgi:two-component system LytT family response regulator